MSDDMVVKPSHYERWNIEPVTFIMINDMEFWRGNIIKYASRAGFKQYGDLSSAHSEAIDLKKIIRFAQMRLNQLEEGKEITDAR